MRAGNRKQAIVPGGRDDPRAGRHRARARRAARDGDGPLVVVLPGPPSELRPMWAAAVETAPLRAVLDRAGAFEQRILRLFGVPESEIALSLRAIEEDGVRARPARDHDLPAARRDRDRDRVRAGGGRRVRRVRGGRSASGTASTLFSEDGASIDELVARLLSGPPARTIAVAESCTGGLMAGRLTDRAGSSAYVLGGVVVYSNEAKVAFADVPAELIERHGAVSPEVAVGARGRRDRALRRRARDRDHGRRGSGRRDAREARRHGLHQRRACGRRAGGPHASSCRATARRSASAPRRSRCTCSGACCCAWRRDGAAAAAPVRRARPSAAPPSTRSPASATPPPIPRSGGRSTRRRSTSRSRSSAIGRRPTSALVGEVLSGLEPRGPLALALGDGLLLPPRRGARAHRGARGRVGRARRAAGRGVGRPGGRGRLHAGGAPVPPARHRRADPLRRACAAGRGARCRSRVAFHAGDVVLYRSRPGRGGARYEPLVSRRL